MASNTKWNMAYDFKAYSPKTRWKAVGAVYIFAKPTSDGGWRAVYVGQTKDMNDRMQDHSDWTAASRLGATAIHARTVSDEPMRKALEKVMIDAWKPPLNKKRG